MTKYPFGVRRRRRSRGEPWRGGGSGLLRRGIWSWCGICGFLCVQGGMQWVGYAELASAVSNAGGLGLVRRIRLNEFHVVRAFIQTYTTYKSKSACVANSRGQLSVSNPLQDAFQHSLNAKARYSRCATGTVFCKYFQLLIMDIVHDQQLEIFAEYCTRGAPRIPSFRVKAVLKGILFKFHALQVIDSAIIRLDTPTKQDAFQHSLNANACVANSRGQLSVSNPLHTTLHDGHYIHDQQLEITIQLTALTQPTPEDLRKEIRRCRTMTKYPFGVNLLRRGIWSWCGICGFLCGGLRGLVG
jgi:hypothetical protein